MASQYSQSSNAMPNPAVEQETSGVFEHKYVGVNQAAVIRSPEMPGFEFLISGNQKLESWEKSARIVFTPHVQPYRNESDAVHPLREEWDEISGLFESYMAQTEFLSFEQSQGHCYNNHCQYLAKTLQLLKECLPTFLQIPTFMLSVKSQALAQPPSGLRRPDFFGTIAHNHEAHSEKSNSTKLSKTLESLRHVTHAFPTNMESKASPVAEATTRSDSSSTSKSIFQGLRETGTVVCNDDTETTIDDRTNEDVGYEAIKHSAVTDAAGIIPEPMQDEIAMDSVDEGPSYLSRVEQRGLTPRVNPVITAMTEVTNMIQPMAPQPSDGITVMGKMVFGTRTDEDLSEDGLADARRNGAIRHPAGMPTKPHTEELDLIAHDIAVVSGNSFVNAELFVEAQQMISAKDHRDNILGTTNNGLETSEIASLTKHNQWGNAVPKSTHETEILMITSGGTGKIGANEEAEASLPCQHSTGVASKPVTAANTEHTANLPRIPRYPTQRIQWQMHHENDPLEIELVCENITGNRQNKIERSNELKFSLELSQVYTTLAWAIVHLRRWLRNQWYVYLQQPVTAMCHFLQFLSFQCWKQITPVSTKAIYVIRKLDWNFLGSRPNFLSRIDWDAHHVLMPTSQGAIYVLRRLLLMLSVAMYILIHQERNIWLQANTMTRQQMLKRVDMEFSWPVEEMGTRQSWRVDKRCLFLLLGHFPDIYIEYFVTLIRVAI